MTSTLSDNAPAWQNVIRWTDGFKRSIECALDGYVPVRRRDMPTLDDDAADCAGNSHSLITYEYSDTEALCACGQIITLVEDDPRAHMRGQWVHATGSRVCPPYNCGCGQRH